MHVLWLAPFLPSLSLSENRIPLSTNFDFHNLPKMHWNLNIQWMIEMFILSLRLNLVFLSYNSNRNLIERLSFRAEVRSHYIVICVQVWGFLHSLFLRADANTVDNIRLEMRSNLIWSDIWLINRCHIHRFAEELIVEIIVVSTLTSQLIWINYFF